MAIKTKIINSIRTSAGYPADIHNPDGKIPGLHTSPYPLTSWESCSSNSCFIVQESSRKRFYWIGWRHFSKLTSNCNSTHPTETPFTQLKIPPPNWKFIHPTETPFTQLQLHSPNWSFIHPAGTPFTQLKLFSPSWNSIHQTGTIFTQQQSQSPNMNSIHQTGTLLTQPELRT